MADQLSALTSNATSGLSGVTGMLQGNFNNLTGTASTLLDRIIPPPTREALKQKLTAFATERPKLAAFILSQVALSGLPLALFIIMSITVFVFALVTGILVGVIGALVFVVLALGFGLFVLLPTLFVTTFFAVAVWLWGVGAYYLVKWFNEKRIPGVHRPLGEGLREEFGLKALGGAEESEKRTVDGQNNGTMNGTKKSATAAETGQRNGHVDSSSNGSKTVEKANHHADGKENHGQTKTSVPKKKAKDTDKTVVKTPVKTVNDVGDGVTDAGKTVTGLIS